ncbi:hypothetical protein Q31a_12680 [Aureliella helgolandensis]|uniref:Uncharacterized protein n=1 Tax=Aureliella helgolandensis TaxID=2527968 RepID=A0A518G334_9BACT|nr:hypothetical protein Q31a_12680 [Aureliella helgolandensis]
MGKHTGSNGVTDPETLRQRAHLSKCSPKRPQADGTLT